jgi:hypothetical protein
MKQPHQLKEKYKKQARREWASQLWGINSRSLDFPETTYGRFSQSYSWKSQDHGAFSTIIQKEKIHPHYSFLLARSLWCCQRSICQHRLECCQKLLAYGLRDIEDFSELERLRKVSDLNVFSQVCKAMTVVVHAWQQLEDPESGVWYILPLGGLRSTQELKVW